MFEISLQELKIFPGEQCKAHVQNIFLKSKRNVLLFYFINTNEIHFNSFLPQYIGAIYHVAIATVIFSHDNMLFPCV